MKIPTRTGAERVQIWVPDTRAAGFAGECARQACLIRDAGAGSAMDDDTWAAASDTTGWTARGVVTW